MNYFLVNHSLPIHGVLGMRYFAVLSMTKSGARSPHLRVMLSVAQSKHLFQAAATPQSE